MTYAAKFLVIDVNGEVRGVEIELTSASAGDNAAVAWSEISKRLDSSTRQVIMVSGYSGVDDDLGL